MNATLSCLNRIVSVGTNSDGRWYVRIEADIRNAELVLRDLGLEGRKVKPLTTVGSDRCNEVQELCHEVVVPFPGSSRLGGTSDVRSQVYGKADTRKPQRSQEGCTLSVGVLVPSKLFRTAFRPTLTATSLDVVRPVRAQRAWFKWFGAHAVKNTSNLQGATGLKVSECEYYGLTHGAAHGLGLKAYMADLGFEMSLHIFSDSSAARAFASRRGLGRQRHVQTRFLWLQERVSAAHLTVQKVRTTQNPPDILIEAASREKLERRRKMLGLRRVKAHSSQKELRSESLDTKKTFRFEPAAIHLRRESARG